MSLRIVLHPSAIAEVQQARTYYAELDEELGEDFENELNVVLLRAQKLPSHGRAWRKSDPGRRVYALRRFPYLVIARITATELRVVAVAHQRRRPGYWTKREK